MRNRLESAREKWLRAALGGLLGAVLAVSHNLPLRDYLYSTLALLGLGLP